MFATNLDGTFYSLQPIVAHMVQRAAAGDAFGRLIATSSMASLFGTARNEHYAASKAAIDLLMQSLAVEYARYCVTANAILPGWIDTEMIADLQESEKFMIAAKIPRSPAAVWLAKRLRGDRCLSDEPRVGFSRWRHDYDRWRLQHFLIACRR